MLKLWGRKSSINVQKVRWALGEVALAYDWIDAGGAAGGLNDPDFLAMNPHGAIPVIDDEGTVLWESNTIVRYLAARHGEPYLSGRDPAQRAARDRWMDWAATTLQPDFMDFFWGWYRTPEARRDAAQNARLMARFHAHFRRLDQWLIGRDFLLGERFSMADIPAGTLLYRYFEMAIPRPETPHLAAWYARLCDRAAYREAVMRPFGELYGRAAP